MSAMNQTPTSVLKVKGKSEVPQGRPVTCTLDQAEGEWGLYQKMEDGAGWDPRATFEKGEATYTPSKAETVVLCARGPAGASSNEVSLTVTSAVVHVSGAKDDVKSLTWPTTAAAIVSAVTVVALIVFLKNIPQPLRELDQQLFKDDPRALLAKVVITPTWSLAAVLVLIGLAMTIIEWRASFRTEGASKKGVSTNSALDVVEVAKVLSALTGAKLVLLSGVVLIVVVGWMTGASVGSNSSPAASTSSSSSSGAPTQNPSSPSSPTGSTPPTAPTSRTSRT